jgi:hypothetical protein
MDQEQQELYDIIQKNYQGVATLKTGKYPVIPSPPAGGRGIS